MTHPPRPRGRDDPASGALSQHLVGLFPGMRAGEVIDVIVRSRRSVDDFGLPANEQLQTVEIMSRYQLMQLSGQMPDNARLKPEDHAGRKKRVPADG